MGQGQGSISVNQKREAAAPPGPPSPPFALNSAYNGLSVDAVTGQIVLGQDVGAVGDPAGLLSNREIPLNGFDFILNDNSITQNFFFAVQPTNGLYILGDYNITANGLALILDDFNQVSRITHGSGNRLFLDAQNGIYQMGDIAGSANQSFLEVDDSTQFLTYNSNGTAWLLLDGTTGALQLPGYGGGTIVGTPTFNLAIDATGNLIEVAAGVVTADNGLNINTPGNVQIGGPLTQDTTINGNLFHLILTGDYGGGGNLLAVTNTNAISGTGVYGNGVVGLRGISTVNGGYGLNAVAVGSSSYGIYSQNNGGGLSLVAENFAASTNTVIPVSVIQRLSSGTAANGIGGNLTFKIQADDGTVYLTNEIISKLTTAANATRVSQFILTGVNNAVTADILRITGGGALTIIGDTTLIHTGTNLANGAAAAIGTLLNAPAAGNPTKWIPVDDNGTTRYIPSW